MKKPLLIGTLWLLSLLGMGQSPAEKACFSVPGGFYEASPTLELFPFYPQHHIRFTTNGNRPTAQSRLYTEPLLLDGSLYSTSDIHTIQMSPEHLVYVPDSVQHCIVIRAAVFDENDSCISEVATNSYFIRSLGCDTHGLPVMSLCADTLDLFDYHTGILVPGVFYNPAIPSWTGNYYQRGILWERCCNWEFYELDNSGVNQQAGLRTHGGNARRGPQKGLKVYAREEYGKKRFEHAFFDSTEITSFKHLLLKPFVDEWFDFGIPNMICQQMAKEINVESLATRPSVLFINGEYWGIYSVSEKPDDFYLESHLGGENEEYNIVGDWFGTSESGDNANFLQLMEWLENTDLSDSVNYQTVCALVDMDCFIDYYCFEIFVANDDWPGNNMRCYQHQDGVWRWIFYDGDNALQKMDFDVFANATYVGNAGWPSNTQSTLMFRKLLENDFFKQRFLARFHQLMSGPFSYETTKTYFDEAADKVRGEVPQQAARFNKPEHLEGWNYLIASIDDFLCNRVDNMNGRLDEYFSVNDSLLLNSAIYPNPATSEDRLHLWSNGFGMTSFVVYDMMGRKICASNVVLVTGENEIQIPHRLSAGLYLVKIGNTTQRIVIQ